MWNVGGWLGGKEGWMAVLDFPRIPSTYQLDSYRSLLLRLIRLGQPTLLAWPSPRDPAGAGGKCRSTILGWRGPFSKTHKPEFLINSHLYLHSGVAKACQFGQRFTLWAQISFSWRTAKTGGRNAKGDRERMCAEMVLHLAHVC